MSGVGVLDPPPPNRLIKPDRIGDSPPSKPPVSVDATWVMALVAPLLCAVVFCAIACVFASSASACNWLAGTRFPRFRVSSLKASANAPAPCGRIALSTCPMPALLETGPVTLLQLLCATLLLHFQLFL